MLLSAFVIFLSVAAVGDFLAFNVWKQRPSPMLVVRAHTIAAIVGLAVLVTGLVQSGGSTIGWVAAGIFGSGLAGGFLLFGWIFHGRRPPLWAVGAHGALGWTGVVTLWFAL